jgi:DNA polymerase IV
VLDELSLGCSVGVAPNKFLAKLASVEAKPRATPSAVEPGPGVVVVVAGEERTFLDPLPVQRLWGVGPVTLDKLHRIGIRRVGDFAEIDEPVLAAALGAGQAHHLLALARGIDDRPVEPEREAKSISHEETYAANKYEHDELRRELVRLADAVAARLRAAGVGARTLTLKLRFDTGFQTITRSVTCSEAVELAPEIVDLLAPLLEAVDPSPGIRLLGVAGSNLGPSTRQLSLDDLLEEQPDWAATTDALDRIRDRFGSGAIGPASALESGRLRVVRRGEQQWGPDAGAGGAGPPDRTGHHRLIDARRKAATALRIDPKRAMIASCLSPRMSNASCVRSSSSSNRTRRSPNAGTGCRVVARSSWSWASCSVS